MWNIPGKAKNFYNREDTWNIDICGKLGIIKLAHLPWVEGVPEDVMHLHSVFC